MKLRQIGLACSMLLLAAACGQETTVEVPAQTAGELSGATEAPTPDSLTAIDSSAVDSSAAELAELQRTQEKLAAQQKAIAEKQARIREQQLAAKRAAQGKQAQHRESAAKGKQGQKLEGLTPEQQRKRQAILDQKASIRSGGKPTGYEGPPGEGPRLTFKRPEINFGEVWDTDTMKGTFEFTNTGKSTLEIQLVKASCGCTSTELDRMEFEPGEGSKIDVEWHPKGFGPQIKSITVTSNSEGSLYTRVMIRATIKPFAKFEPEPTRFNNVRIFQEHKVRTTLTCVDPNFELVDLRTSNPHLTAVELERQPNGDRSIELTLDDSTPWGMFNASVIAKVRGVRSPGEETQERDAILHVGGSIFGDLEVTPNLFSVGRVAPRGKIRFAVVLKSSEGKDFTLTKAVVENSQPPGMTLRGEPIPGGGIRVWVEGEAGDYEGLIRGTAVMETDLAGEGERRLPIMGIVRP